MNRVALRVKKAGTFKPGNGGGPGRGAGKPNRVTTLLKDAIIMAAEKVGEDGDGKDELVGYLKRLAKNEPKAFAGLLGRVLPYHIIAKHDHEHTVVHTMEELAEEFKARGLPVKRIFETSGYVPGDHAKVIGSNKEENGKAH